MEHIVQFGINIDDTAIAETIKRDAFNEVVKQLAREARNDLPKKWDGFSSKKVDWEGIIGKEIEKQVSGIISNKSDEIVEMAVKRVYKSLTGRKSFRDACKRMDVVFDGLGDENDAD